MKKRAVGLICWALAGVLTLGGCALAPGPVKEPETLGELAYDRNKDSGYTVYIRENGAYTPFLVLTDAYNGQEGAALLVRQYAYPEEMPYTDTGYYGSRGSYYPTSDVDEYLRVVYPYLLDPALRDAVLTTDVIVTTLASSHSGGSLDETETVPRGIFLLSFFELGAKTGVAVEEGQTLRYFKDAKDLAVYLEDETPVGYWTRNAYQLDDIHACAVSFNALIGGEPVSLPLYIRPAFCLNGETKLVQSKEVVPGETVYLLNLE